jgi:Dullard-like phosphatase family protein
LDLDECLIHTVFDDDDSSPTHQMQREAGQKAGDGHHVQSFFLPPYGKINVRPHLAEFLEAVTGRYETYVFTAGTQAYADAVLDQLDPQGRLAGRLYRQHCVPDFGTYVKDLSILGKHRMHRTVLVDNNYNSFKANPLNGIPIATFFDNPQDRALLPMLDVFRNLENVPDVRTVLGHWFDVWNVLTVED